jgi:hypothetical protein
MTEDTIRNLRRIQAHAAGLRDLLADLPGREPARAAGTDRSGAVRLLLGPDGLPESVHLAPDWPRRLPATDLGDAVLAASLAAAGQRMTAWPNTPDRQPTKQPPDPTFGVPAAKRPRSPEWPGSVDSRESPEPRSPVSPVSPVSPESMESPVSPESVESMVSLGSVESLRSLESLAEEVLCALSRVGELAAEAPILATGQGSAGGAVVLTLSRMGLQSCTIDPAWAAGQSAATVTAALGTALAAARADLDRAAPVPPSGVALDRLFAEASAILAGQSRPADS